MDAGGGRSSARKRKAAASSAPAPATAAALALRKKSRRSSRERSEFVSVEVGMREFKKRLASSASTSTTTDSTATSKASALPAVISTAVAPKPTPTPKSEVATRAKATTTKAKAAAAPAPKAAKPAAKKAAAPRKTPARSTTKPTPVKRVTRQTKLTAKPTTRKLTLAEVKLQLEREQQQRVESRIQTLHQKAQSATSTDASSTVAGSPMSQQQPPEEKVDTVAAQPSEVQQVPEVHHNFGTAVQASATTPVESASNTVAVTAVEAPTVPAEVPTVSVKNEFIADDEDEDMMFMLALEEVERKMVSSEKPPASTSGSTAVSSTIPAVTTATTTTINAVASSPIGSQPTLTPSSPSQAPPSVAPAPAVTPVATTSNTQSSQAVEKQETPSMALSPEVLEEMERLRRENELLRRSNELLQARASDPTLESTNDPKPTAAKSKAKRVTQESCQQTKPRARFLDLGRPRAEPDSVKALSFQETKPMSEERDENHGHGTTEDHAAAESSVDHSICDPEGSEKHDDTALGGERVVSDAAVPQSTDSPMTSRWDHDTRESKTDADHAPVSNDENDNKVSSAAKEDACDKAPVSSHVDAPMETAGERLLSDYLSAEDSVGGQGALETTGSDDGDVSDANMSDAEDEDIELSPKEPPQRMSTIDTGNYVEYKKREADKAEAAQVEHAVYTQDRKLPKELSHPVDETHVDGNARESVVVPSGNAVNDNQGLETSAISEILDRTTAPSNTEDEDEENTVEEKTMEEEDDDECVVGAKSKARLHVLPSSSESESESDDDDEDMDESDSDDNHSANMLEAALKAAGSDSKKNPKVHPATTGSKRTPTVTKKAPDSTLPRGQEGRQHSRALPVGNAAARLTSTPAKATPKKKSSGVSSNSNSAKRAPATIRSSLLWPTLDEFYDFLLDLPPRHVRSSEYKQKYLQHYTGSKLPTHYATVDDYCGLQLEAILEELVASVSNATESGGGAGPKQRLPLRSVSPCGSQATPSSSLGLSTGAIFSESGFSGVTSNNSDYILSFHASAFGSKSFSGFLSGDLVLVRSPRWKNYELCTFGVVLCSSVVAEGSKGGGSGESDQLCVLVRAQKRGQEDTAESFAVLTELCLSNQRAPNWRWTLQQIHNTTTSAREFQAIKSVTFFPRDLTRVLLDGKLSLAKGGDQKQHKSMKTEVPTEASSVLSPRLLKYLRGNYNESQMKAILCCLGEDNKVIIQGPPGTGKTRTILGLLSALLDGAGLSTLQKAKGTSRIRVGASLQSATASSVSKTVAETSIRILVAAPSNAAVDELVVRLLSEGVFDGEKGTSYRPRIVRVGRPESAQQQRSGAGAAREASENKKNRKKLRKYAREVEEVLLESLVAKHRSAFPTAKQARQAVLKNAQIVFCTLSGAGSVAMCEFAQDFDALVVDEAAQAVEASTLIPFKFRPHRVVLVGDHRQLPATVISKKLVRMGYDRSLLQRLVEKDSPVLLLNKQYRMHPAIAEFPSTYFYGGRLMQEQKLRDWTARKYHREELLGPFVFLDVLGGAQSQVNGSKSLRNLSEVEAVVQLVRLLLHKFPGLDWRKKLGVIAPYKQQIHEVRAALARLEVDCDRQLDIEVNTVDGFQGREKEIIIYSCVRTSAAHSGGTGGRGKKRKKRRAQPGAAVLDAFWADERRMNVAITRAKSSLWIVGNSALLSQSRAWDALIRHAKSKGSYVGDGAAKLLAEATAAAAATAVTSAAGSSDSDDGEAA